MVCWKLLCRLERVFTAVLLISVGSGMVEGVTKAVDMAITLAGADGLVDSVVNLSKLFGVEDG